MHYKVDIKQGYTSCTDSRTTPDPRHDKFAQRKEETAHWYSSRFLQSFISKSQNNYKIQCHSEVDEVDLAVDPLVVAVVGLLLAVGEVDSTASTKGLLIKSWVRIK